MIIAEISANHCQKYQKAIRLVQAASECGADAVKVQMFTPDQMAMPDGEKVWEDKTLYELYKETCMPIEWVPELKDEAELLGLQFIATVYHPDMVKTAVEMEIPILKIASFELNWIDLIEEVAKTKIPVILSTGMAELSEILDATEMVRKYHNDLCLLKCTSDYPAKIENMNLVTIPDMAHKFNCPVGLSDHTTGTISAVIATMMGAPIIEKHLKLDESSVDAKFSVTLEVFKGMVNAVKAISKALGEIKYGGEKKFRREKVGEKWVRT